MGERRVKRARQAQTRGRCSLRMGSANATLLLLLIILLPPLRPLRFAIATMGPTRQVSAAVRTDGHLLPPQLQICSVARLICDERMSNCASSSAHHSAGSVTENSVLRDGQRVTAMGQRHSHS